MDQKLTSTMNLPAVPNQFKSVGFFVSLSINLALYSKMLQEYINSSAMHIDVHHHCQVLSGQSSRTICLSKFGDFCGQAFYEDLRNWGRVVKGALCKVRSVDAILSAIAVGYLTKNKKVSCIFL